MNTARLISMLNEIKAFAEEALKELGSDNSRSAARSASSAKKATLKSPDTLPDWVLKLRTEGFFRQPKIPMEVHEKLQSQYPCDPNRVAVAVLRLHKRKELRKTSKVIAGKKQVAYVW